MADMIKDGRGSGKLCGVDNEYRLLTSAVTHSEALFSAEHVDYYIVSNATGPPHGTADGWLLYLENNSSDRVLYIQEIQISLEDEGHWHMGYGGTVASGTTDVTPINMYIGSANIAETIAYKGTPIYYSTNPSRFAGGHLAAHSKHIEMYNGSLILAYKNSISLYIDTNDGAGRAAVGIQFYFKDKDSHH